MAPDRCALSDCAPYIYPYRDRSNCPMYRNNCSTCASNQLANICEVKGEAEWGIDRLQYNVISWTNVHMYVSLCMCVWVWKVVKEFVLMTCAKLLKWTEIKYNRRNKFTRWTNKVAKANTKIEESKERNWKYILSFLEFGLQHFKRLIGIVKTWGLQTDWTAFHKCFSL